MPAIAFDIEAVREQKASLLRADHERLLEQLGAVTAALRKVRRVAKSEGVDLDGGAPTMGKVLTVEGVHAIWDLLMKGKSQIETARIVGVSKEVVSKVANRITYRDITDRLPDLPEQGRWRHASEG
jgi:hypothetical protein